MPRDGAGNAPFFRERLRAPVAWWVIATVGVAVGGAEVFAGFDWHVIVVVYAALAIPTAGILLAMGHLLVEVDESGLHAGQRTLAATDIAATRVLDARETRQLLGPGADPAAHVVVRGYVRESVLVRPSDGAAPYWLISSRRPQLLLAALDRLRS